MSRQQLERRPLFPGHRPERGLMGEIDRHGNEVWYYRQGHGPRTRIRGEFGSAGFVEAYKAAKWGRPQAQASQAPAKTLREDTLAWLIDQYESSSAWRQTGAQTQKQRRNILKRIAVKHGERPYKALTQADVEKTREDVAKTAPAMANAVVKTLRVLFDWATPTLTPVNIARDVKLVELDDNEGFHTWTEEEIAKFEACYPLGTRERLAFAVLLYTGQRRSDAIALGDQHVRDGVLRLTPMKTRKKKGTKVAIPVLPELTEALAQGPRGEMVWIVGDKGLPITADTFTLWFRKVCDAAGLPECSAHGLRKAAARRFAEHGATVDELKAWFGWTENRTPGIYTAEAEREIMAANAAKRLGA